MKFRIENDLVYDAKGKLVAKLDADGNPVMELGCAGSHKKPLLAFLKKELPEPEFPKKETPEAPEHEEEVNSDRLSAGEEFPEAPEVAPESPAPEAPAPAPETELAEFDVANIPESELPSLDPALGVAGGEFIEFCQKHRLTAAQKMALVVRLTAKKHK